jgi:hypothetical protein
MSNKEFKLTAEGSLGVLALGDIGIKLWREQRKKEGKDPYDHIKEDDKKEEDGKEAGE